MEHRGIEYQVVQTASPTGFRWTVQLSAEHSRTGTSYAKGNAVFRAIGVIDDALAKRAREGLTVEPLIDLAPD
jgi:hypothetical protein